MFVFPYIYHRATDPLLISILMFSSLPSPGFEVSRDRPWIDGNIGIRNKIHKLAELTCK